MFIVASTERLFEVVYFCLQFARVADFAEGVVVVAAHVADPIACSMTRFLPAFLPIFRRETAVGGCFMILAVLVLSQTVETLRVLLVIGVDI